MTDALTKADMDRNDARDSHPRDVATVLWPLAVLLLAVTARWWGPWLGLRP